jgi:glucokinase
MCDILADIGATNARFGMFREKRLAEKTHIFKCEDFLGFEDAYRAYIKLMKLDDEKVARAAVAIAGPVTGDLVRMTNHPWGFSRKAVKKELNLERFVVVNDFTAVALSLSELDAEDSIAIGENKKKSDFSFPVGVLGAGTGLGVSGLIPDGQGGFVPLSGEGGHVTLAPYNDREAELLAAMRGWFGHVSAERVLCGSGLVNLYKAIAQIDKREVVYRKPEDITDAALRGDEMSVETLNIFCAMLGTVAGNLALVLGARGGIYIAGGIVPKVLSFFRRSPFRDRFLAKGRFENYLSAIPTRVITHDLPAFLGLEAAFKSDRY